MSRRIRVTIDIPAPPATVWADIRRIQRHVEWMDDAVAITFTTPQHEGEGTSFDCATQVGPIRLTDRMIVTEWDEEHALGIRHVGLVTGSGRFTLVPVGSVSTQFSWEEVLVFPWWMGGPIGELIGGVVLGRLWRRNLRNLRDRFASPLR